MKENSTTSDKIEDKMTEEDLQTLESKISTSRILREICFSKEECELKESYGKVLRKIPKEKIENVGEMFNGIQIIESKSIPKNMMVWKYSNPTESRMFKWVEGKVYEIEVPRVEFREEMRND